MESCQLGKGVLMHKILKRRDFLAGLSVIMGGAILATEKTVALAENFIPGEVMTILNKNQTLILEKIIDIIIPETDTPGGIMVRVPLFIDHMLAHQMSKTGAGKFVKSLDDLIASLPGFLKKDRGQQIEAVKKLDNEMWQGNKNSDFYRSLKELILIGYYTSEAGASMELYYDPVPGPYHRVSLEEYNRTWATRGY